MFRLFGFTLRHNLGVNIATLHSARQYTALLIQYVSSKHTPYYDITRYHHHHHHHHHVPEGLGVLPFP